MNAIQISLTNNEDCNTVNSKKANEDSLKKANKLCCALGLITMQPLSLGDCLTQSCALSMWNRFDPLVKEKEEELTMMKHSLHNCHTNSKIVVSHSSKHNNFSVILSRSLVMNTSNRDAFFYVINQKLLVTMPYSKKNGTWDATCSMHVLFHSSQVKGK